MNKMVKNILVSNMFRHLFGITKLQTKPVGRWIVDHNNWELQAKYATIDSCGGDLCRKNPIKNNKL